MFPGEDFPNAESLLEALFEMEEELRQEEEELNDPSPPPTPPSPRRSPVNQMLPGGGDPPAPSTGSAVPQNPPANNPNPSATPSSGIGSGTSALTEGRATDNNASASAGGASSGKSMDLLHCIVYSFKPRTHCFISSGAVYTDLCEKFLTCKLHVHDVSTD